MIAVLKVTGVAAFEAQMDALQATVNEILAANPDATARIEMIEAYEIPGDKETCTVRAFVDGALIGECECKFACKLEI